MSNADNSPQFRSDEPAAIVRRGDGIEAIHCATIAVVDAEGNLTHSLGDPSQSWMTRSAVKPFQALPLILTGGFDHFGFSQRQLAIMCASHNGTDEHREVTLSNLELAGNSTQDLQCGTHLPSYMRLNGLYPSNDEDKDSLRHNCSGKHSGFLALSRYLNEHVASYLEPGGKAQQMVKQSVADICRFPVEKIAVGIDGCSAPVFSLPPLNLAIGFMRLATLQADEKNLNAALGRVRSAMYEYPYLISGEKRMDYDLMRSYPENIICKIGAESIEAIGFADPPIGICVKILDGNIRALGAVCVEVFRQLGLINRIENFPELQKYNRPEVRNYRKLLTGNIEPVFELKKVV